MGIVSDKAIRATHARYMNDAQEMQVAFDMAAGQLSGDYGEKWPQHAEGIEKFIDYRRGTDISPNVFISSFTESPDLLSQWRAYGGGGAAQGPAYSIGLPSDELARLAGRRHWRLSQCIYDPSQQMSIVRDAIRAAIEPFDDPVYARGHQDPAAAVSNSLFAHMMNLAPVFKHQAFSEEREWRLISPLLREGFEFRAGPLGLVPYVRFGLPEQDGKLRITDVFVGPTQDATTAQNSLTTFLRINEVSWGSVKHSMAPYRNW
jgi:hypothetical protein